MLKLENLPSNVFSSMKTLPKKNKQLFYLANDKRKRFGWKYIWTNNGRIHLRQTNDSKVISNDSLLSDMKKTSNRSKSQQPTLEISMDHMHLLTLFENSLMKYLSPPFGMVSGLHIVLTFAWCVIIHLIIHLTINHGSLQNV